GGEVTPGSEGRVVNLGYGDTVHGRIPSADRIELATQGDQGKGSARVTDGWHALPVVLRKAIHGPPPPASRESTHHIELAEQHGGGRVVERLGQRGTERPGAVVGKDSVRITPAGVKASDDEQGSVECRRRELFPRLRE